MPYAIEASTNNPSTTFVLNGLEFSKDVYTIEYGSYEDNSGTPTNVKIGLINKFTGKFLVPPSSFDEYTDGTTAFGSLDALISHLSSTVGFNLAGASALTTTDGLVFVDSASDLPAPVSGVITLVADTTYFFLQHIDLGGDRIACPAASIAIVGTSSETASITSTGLGASTALITATRTLVLQNITFKDVGTCFDIDGTGGTNVALDWQAFNLSNVTTIGTIQNIDNNIWTTCAILDSGGLTYTGDVATVAFNNSIISVKAGTTGVIFDANAVVSRRFRIIYTAVVAGAPTANGIEVNASASIPTESYILDTVNFAGGGTYLVGLDHTSNDTLFVNCIGITNSNNISNYYMNGNSTATVVSSTLVEYKAAGTTTSNSISSKFTNTDNRATYVGAITRQFKVTATASLTSGNNNQIGTYIAKNGTVITSTEVYVTTNGSGRAENVVVQGIVELAENDYVEIWVENATGTSNITVTDLNLIVE